MKQTYIFLFLLCFGFSSYSQSYDAHVENIINSVNIDSLIYQLRNLSGEDQVVISGETTTIDHRVSNWGNNLASVYILQELGKLGLSPQIHAYSMTGHNVYAVQEGSVYPDEYYMICAHYDAVDYYCADDNASGSAAVLEAARLFKDLEFEYSIIYAFWDEEEIGLIGSNNYATQAASNGDIIHAVINMDMISWDADEDMVAELHSSYNANSNLLADYLIEVNDIYGLELNPVIELPGTTASDHSSFWNHGYPSVLVIEEYYGGDFNPYYHTEQDRIGILNMPYFHEMAKLSIGTLASLSRPLLETSVDEMALTNPIHLKAFPNPFHENANLSYSLEEESYLRISLLNSQGKEVSVLEEGVKASGDHQLQINAQGLSSGLYLLYSQTPKASFTQKIVVN